MLIYVIIFAVSTFMFYIPERIRGKWIRKILIIIGILLPSILAGCRADTVGVDVLTYGKAFYLDAVYSSSFNDYFSSKILASFSEIGFHFVNYILSRFFVDYHWGFFFYELLIITFMYFGFSVMKKVYHIPIWMCMLLFYLFYYNASLNAMRQSIALSILFYAITFIFVKNYKRFIVFAFIATLFHASAAIIACVIVPMYLLLQQDRKIDAVKQTLQGSIFIVVSIIALYFTPNMINYLVSINIFRSLYAKYLLNDAYGTNDDIAISLLIIYMIYMVLHILLKKSMDSKHLNSLFFLMLSVLMVGLSLGGHSFNRISYYFFPLQIVSLNNMRYCFTLKSRWIWVLGISTLMVIYWIIVFVILKHAGTVPYEFFW